MLGRHLVGGPCGCKLLVKLVYAFCLFQDLFGWLQGRKHVQRVFSCFGPDADFGIRLTRVGF